MKFMIVVIMQFLPQEDATDFFIFTEPNFESYAECTLYLRQPENAQKIGVKLIEQFGFRMIENVFCAPEFKINRYILEQEST
tara:strand:+ start:978 stop:1223 length:246 start_codon:yes stop_codon:yes gene_type:complete